MKKGFIIVIGLIILGALTLAGAGIVQGVHLIEAQRAEQAIDSLYSKTTIVETIDEENDLVVCVDCEGEAWEFEGVEDWQEGDFATLLMDDNGTEEIFDDEIVKIEYNGNVEGLE